MENKAGRLALARGLSLGAVVAISIFVYGLKDKADALAIYGYPGIFLIALLTNATVLLPAPGIAVVFAMGAVFHPCGVALAAGAGGALGELSGYLAGFSGQAIIENTALYERFYQWMHKNGSGTVFVLAALPNPFFDLAGVAAGALKMPVLRFLFWCWVGVTLKMFIFAWVGSSSIAWILGW